uniref:LamG-like jellyroll fold domain-containing protein n=1 Tax=Cellvibrio fontiphilus TaxID=1815559 RepID=UPI002B4BBCA6|nr:LamG-like jellyroll fold domain-containing protein [Cellvibrio fontiphilus]
MKLKSLALAMSGLLILAGCGGGGDNEKSYASVPASPEPVYAKPSVASGLPLTAEGAVAWADIGVHDPSVVKAGSDYYIFGSHLAAAKSSDLINWEYISVLSANDRVDESPLFNTYSTEISEGIAWSDGFKGNWAANVIKAPNGKYWFYYNHCAQVEADNGGCWNRSYLGLAEADAITGPYADKGVFLRSGYRNAGEFTSFPLDDGQTTWNGAVDPNVIDPTAFYDKAGGMWMVYGSYSGGIFVLEMDSATGKPKAGQGYGTHLVGGDFRAIEGAFVMYSPIADYYYLFYSVAGFAANDGYNIRIARSKSPKGPYLDPAGNDIADGAGLEVGGKLLGGFEFTQVLGEVAPSWGYQAPGHNSAYYDEATKRHLLVTHTRFPSTATSYPGNIEAHAVRTHEMFVNQEGWLVVSPQRYVPLNGNNVVDVAEVPGHYKFVNQGKGVNKAAIKSGHITLHENRSVSGSDKGSWMIMGDDSIKLVLDSGTYFGVLKWQWDNGIKELVPVFSAMARDGASVFGTRTDRLAATSAALTTVAAALDIKTELTLADEGYSLPTVGKSGTKIDWVSSNEYYIDSKGNVFIPTPDLGDQTVTLTANLSLGGQVTTKSFTVKVKARPAFKNAVAHYRFENALTDSMGNYAAAKTTDNNLFNVDATTPTFAAGYTGGQAYDFNGANGVRLPDDIIKSSEYTVSFWMKAENLTTHTPAFFMATDFDHWSSYIPGNAWFTSSSLIWSNYMGNWNQVVHSATAPLNQWQHVAITYGNGMMNLYIDGAFVGAMPRDDIFKDGGLYALGVNFGWDLPFVGQIDDLIVYDYALSTLDINGAAINNLTDPSQFAGFVKDALELGDMSAVRENFELLRVGPFVSGISWTSSDEKYLKPTNGVAVVTQPTADEGDKTVTLTAHINYQGFTDTKEFQVTVKSLAPAEYSFENSLVSLNDVAPAGTVAGDRIFNTGGAISYIEGVKGQAVNLNGTSGIRLPDNLITTSSYTISLWLKPTAFTDYTTAFFGGANPNYWLSLVPSMAGTAKTRVWANGPSFYDNAELANRIPAGQWTHIVIMVDGENNNTIKLYVNGALQSEATDFRRVMTVAGDTNEFALGVNYWDTPFNGAIDELKVFTGTISAERINSLYQEGSSAQ